MEKIIHYCWFGGNPLSKMAKKCIKSWKKYFPDYEIKEWNESNFDINICPFVKEAYKNKKWAFVSDYARLYALYQYGGIYLDTDMEIQKKCDDLLEDDFFIGYEENNIIAAGVIGVKNKQNKYIKELLGWYEDRISFHVENVFEYTIPKVITKIFSKYKKETINDIDIVDGCIKIYPSEYFYPINYNYSKKNFTKNTYMIHYYNATWAPKEEKIAIFFLRKFGLKFGRFLLNKYYKICNLKNRIKGFFIRKKDKFRHFLSVHINYKKRVQKVKSKLEEYKNNKYVMIYHPDWLGLSHVAKDNFEYIVPLREQYTAKEAKLMAKEIALSNVDVVIFNGFAFGWDILATELKNFNPKIVIKVLWHGSNSLLTEDYDFCVFFNILQMYKKKIICEIGFVKKSMYEFYNAKGYKCSFIMNSMDIKGKEQYKKERKQDGKTHIGLYCSGDRWIKNTYNQLSAVSLIENAILDCIPMNFKLKTLANEFGLEFSSSENNLPREELFSRIAQNDVNLYITFSECAPLIPLESLELGVPCITGDTHHYFEGTDLEKYLVVNKEDNIIEIADKIKYAMENKEQIMKLYECWKEDYVTKAKESIKRFTEK